MKVTKGLILFCFLGISISACFDPPQFKDEPEISYNKIQFKETPEVGVNDSLILYIDFKDGNGDLGLDDNYRDEPFHDAYYYLADGTGNLDSLITEIVQVKVKTGTKEYPLLKKKTGDTGKLVTDRTRSEPNYGYLPVYDQNNCVPYSVAELLVPADVVDDTYNITDTINDQFANSYYVIQDVLFYKKNRYYNNIEIKLWVFENGNFVEFKGFEELCIDLNGRFPVLTSQEGPLEGTIRYGIVSTSFLAFFSVKTLKLSARIIDRSRNISEEIFTPQFTLDAIRVN